MKMHAAQALKEAIALDAEDHLARPISIRSFVPEDALFQVRVGRVLARSFCLLCAP